MKENTPVVPKIESRIIQMIRMGKSIRHKWVNPTPVTSLVASSRFLSFLFFKIFIWHNVLSGENNIPDRYIVVHVQMI